MDEGIETAVEEINNIQASLTNKAEKATTLAGYGITDAYTKSYIDKLLNNKLDKMGFDTEPTLNSPNYLTSGTVYTALQKKADKSTTLAGYGITDAYTKNEADGLLVNKANKATTLAGYGITDAYTKDETQKNYGLNFSVGFNSSYIPITIDTTTDIQNGTFTSSDIVTAFISSDVEYIRSGAFTGCTNLKSVYILNTPENITVGATAFNEGVQINYINSYNYLKYVAIALRNMNTQKPDKATTLAGYGITDAYTKENAKNYFGFGVSVGFDINGIPVKIVESTSIGAGLFSNSSVTTIFLSSKVTTLQSGALAGCSALTDVYINNTEDGLTIQSGAIPSTAVIHYVNDYEFGKSYIKALATIPIIQTKLASLPTYEEGSGTLTPTAENKLKNASFTYQRLGNCVTVQVACTFLAYEQTADGTVRLDGLPFVCGNTLPPRLLNITSQKREVISAISYSTSALVLIFRQAESFTEDETLSFEITYKIK